EDVRPLQPHGAGADDRHTGWDLLHAQQLVAVDHSLEVRAGDRRPRRFGTGGDDDVTRLDALRGIVASHLDLPWRKEPAAAREGSNPVFPHQVLHAAPELLHDLIAALDHRGIVGRYFAGGETELLAAARRGERLDAGKHRLRRDAPYIEACAAQI